MSVHSRSLLFPRCPWTHHSLPQVTKTPLRPVVSQVNTGRVQQSKPAARLALFLGMRVRFTERGGCAGTWGGVSVRLTRFVLSLFVLQESYERLPRCLALQRAEMEGDIWQRQKNKGRDRDVSIHYVICTARSFQNQPYCKCFLYIIYICSFSLLYFFLFPIYVSWLLRFLLFILLFFTTTMFIDMYRFLVS